MSPLRDIGNSNKVSKFDLESEGQGQRGENFFFQNWRIYVNMNIHTHTYKHTQKGLSPQLKAKTSMHCRITEKWNSWQCDTKQPHCKWSYWITIALVTWYHNQFRKMWDRCSNLRRVISICVIWHSWEMQMHLCFINGVLITRQLYPFTKTLTARIDWLTNC